MTISRVGVRLHCLSGAIQPRHDRSNGPLVSCRDCGIYQGPQLCETAFLALTCVGHVVLGITFYYKEYFTFDCQCTKSFKSRYRSKNLRGRFLYVEIKPWCDRASLHSYVGYLSKRELEVLSNFNYVYIATVPIR